jgi:diguanylate cyclase (GGDEF)-like protein
MRILLVEDDVDQRELMRETIGDTFGSGTVTCAESGHEALGLNLADFDVILIDFNLPDISGVDLLKTLRDRTAKPLIVVTGDNLRQTAEQAIRAGADDFVLKVGEYLYTIPLILQKNIDVFHARQENLRLHEQQIQQAREIAIKNQQLKETLQKMEEMAARDPLTGLYNRRHFAEVLERSFAEAARYAKDLACIMADLDGFKKLNDTEGHQAGDRILRATANMISSNLRVMDVAARYGGDEFVILLPHASADLASQVGERISRQFQLHVKQIVAGDLHLSMSMGIASMQHNRPLNSDQLVALADEALYAAKRQGKNRTIISAHGQTPAHV